MGSVVFFLCFITSLLCAFLLFRTYFAGRNKLLLWLGICFSGFAINNLLLFFDHLTFANIDMVAVRGLVALFGLLVLVYGLVREATL